MDSLENFKMFLLTFNIFMIYTIHEILIFLKNHLNYLKDNILECIFKKYNRLFFFKKIVFLQHIMMENPRPEEENIIKDIRNLFRLKKETKAIKDRILWDIKNLFKHEKEEENYYQPVRVSNFCGNNYIQYKSNGDKNKILSVEEYRNEISSYLKDILNNLKKSDN